MGLFFDKRDEMLLETINALVHRERQPRALQSLANPFLHPHGIKEMVANSDVRIANAAIALLHSIEIGKAEERIHALRTLHDEVMHTSQTGFRRNTARALLAIMKDLIRVRNDRRKQLFLSHDFHEVASGKPRKVRETLRRYHLLEMPEDWNQIAFDDHVHDANTKGRKSPTHLVMDAWIKGIRYLTVIYYNHVRLEVAAELLEAAKIMGVRVRIGIEIPARFRDQYIRLIWIPRGFLSQHDFLDFLADQPVREFMEECREISDYRQKHVLRILHAFNAKHRSTVNQEFGIDIDPIDESQFLAFVSSGQPSLLHLAEFINSRLLEAFEIKVQELRAAYPNASAQQQNELKDLVTRMNEIDSVILWERFLKPCANPELPDPNVPGSDPEAPAQMNRSLSDLIHCLHQLPTGYRLTLNLSELTPEDVLEILYDAGGKITQLEIFNLKDYATNKSIFINEIDEIRHLINSGNIIGFKRFTKKIITHLEHVNRPDSSDRIAKLHKITEDVGSLMNYYFGTPLAGRIGSDSAGRSKNIHGMGLAILETLPRRAISEIKQSKTRSREIVPVQVPVCRRFTYIPKTRLAKSSEMIASFFQRIFGWYRFGSNRQEEWIAESAKTRITSTGNLGTLGGLSDDTGTRFTLEHESAQPIHARSLWFSELNTKLKISIKIVLGLIPAFLTFALTKDWWLLAYFGAFIWFGITSVRNIMQSVIGGGGFRRSPLLRWNDHVSWGRIADSLMYTGFSVPLLDFIVKTVILDRGFNITASTYPWMLYSFIAVANGLYIASHNTFRGLPRQAILGNLFRTVLSIPLAFAINSTIGHLLLVTGTVEMTGHILQNWAAIISKAASDIVAGFIEGFADRSVNLERRMRDYQDKIQQVSTCHSRLELLYPDRDVLNMLKTPKEFVRTVKSDAEELEKIVIMNALDLLYFYMFQPRARTALKVVLKNMNEDERQVFIHAQSILERKKEISQYVVDGLVGKYFAKALAFYLERVDFYLEALKHITHQTAINDEKSPPGNL